MDLFTQIKMAVSVKEAAEYYGLDMQNASNPFSIIKANNA